MNELVKKALSVARDEIGTVEAGGANRGRKVGQYLASTGLGQGYPWCAAFVYWCIEQAAKDTGQSNPFIRTAGCAVIDVWAKENDIREGRPEPGDVFLRRGTVNSVFRACHTGFVTTVDGTVFKTVEGNTNMDGSREGYGVFARQRTNSDRYAFVRWGRLVKGAAAAEEAEQEVYKLFVSDDEKPLCDMPVHGGRSLCPVRLWGERLGFTVEWNADDQIPLFDGKEIVTETVLIDSKAYAPIRDLAESAGLQLTVDVPSHTVRVTRVL